MLQQRKRQVKLFEIHCFTMFITALCVIFVFFMKLRWPKNQRLYVILKYGSEPGAWRSSTNRLIPVKNKPHTAVTSIGNKGMVYSYLLDFSFLDFKLCVRF